MGGPVILGGGIGIVLNMNPLRVSRFSVGGKNLDATTEIYVNGQRCTTRACGADLLVCKLRFRCFGCTPSGNYVVTITASDGTNSNSVIIPVVLVND